MKNIVKHTLACACVVILTMTSCNYLDVADNFEEAFKYDSIWINKTNLQRYVWNIPTAFPDEGYKFDKLGSFACDEAFSIMISDYTHWTTFREYHPHESQGFQYLEQHVYHRS